MSYLEHLMQHARLAILRFLAAAPSYSGNESLLTDAVNSVGVVVTRDQVKTAIGWLAEQGLVTVEELHGLTIAKATQRGIEVAEGRAIVAGVKRPSPR